MANQTVSTDDNHDYLTGRAAGEDITINSGATVTIDSMPHLTPMGILGDITLSGGNLVIDGSRTFEIAYSGGVNDPMPAVPGIVDWKTATDFGKIIRVNSGDFVSGVLTLTVDVGYAAPEVGDVITDGYWYATVDSVRVGYLIIYGEDQDWGGLDGRDSITITGDWYEVATGTGANSQTFELPHTGHQHALWIETGSGTGVFEIWHRIASGASTVWYDSFAEFGAHYESGKVFQQTFGDATVTFGTSTAGGAPPSGARIRIPNVHIGTTTTGAPTTEVNSTTFAAHLTIVPPNTSVVVNIDHLNLSSAAVNFVGTGEVNVSDSAIGMSGTFISKIGGEVTIDNCCWCHPSVNTTGGIAASMAYVITDNLNPVTFNDCVFVGGVDATSAQALSLVTCANIVFTGTTKIVLSITDENTSYALRGSVTSNVSFETLILLGGGVLAGAGCNNWAIDDLRIGYPPGRGTTEQNQSLVNATGVFNWDIKSGNLVNGGKWPIVGPFLLTDVDTFRITNFGTPSAKLDGGNRLTYVANLAGISQNVTLKRLWFDNLNGAQAYQMLNSVRNVLIENCSGEYTDEIENDAFDCLIKGLHGASGSVDAATGVEGDNINVVGAVFLDYFKSNTTGALGLTFNAPGAVHAADVEFTAGTPLFNGLGDLLMRTNGDQVVYTWPYSIRGHTAFQNAAIQVSAVGSYTYEYDLDTGSGFSGSWTAISGANLSAETISPSGFGFKVRITSTADNASAAIKGLAVLTNTTLSDQASNLYPISTVPVSVTVLDAITGDPIEDARVRIETIGAPAGDGVVVLSGLTNASGVLSGTTEYVDQVVGGKVRRATVGLGTLYKTSPVSSTITSLGLDLTILLIPDE